MQKNRLHKDRGSAALAASTSGSTAVAACSTDGSTDGSTGNGADAGARAGAKYTYALYTSMAATRTRIVVLLPDQELEKLQL